MREQVVKEFLRLNQFPSERVNQDEDVQLRLRLPVSLNGGAFGFCYKFVAHIGLIRPSTRPE